MTTSTAKQTLESIKDEKLAAIDRRLQALNGSADHPGYEVHKIAREQVARGELPGRKQEDCKYTPARNVFTRQYGTPSSPVNPQDDTLLADAWNVRIVNGVLDDSSKIRLPNGVTVKPWHDTRHEPGAAGITEKVARHLRSSEMPIFEAIGLGLAPMVTLIEVPDNVVCEKPIHISHRNATGIPSESYSYIIIQLGSNSQASIVESFVNDETNENFINNTTRVYLDKGSHLAHYRMQSESYKAFMVSQTSVFQERDSNYGIYLAEFGGLMVRNNIHIEHRGENISSNIYGAYIARERQHIDTQSFIDHARPNCQSNELFKGVLLDYGRGVFNGKIIVRPDAQKTNAFQQNAALVLSPNATVDSKPQLEIFADDVKCSHGATIGQLDQDSMFYLKSRGLSDSQARALLKKAFLKNVIDQFPDERIVNYFMHFMEKELAVIAENEMKTK